jgi:hypothetical protein
MIVGAIEPAALAAIGIRVVAVAFGALLLDRLPRFGWSPTEASIARTCANGDLVMRGRRVWGAVDAAFKHAEEEAGLRRRADEIGGDSAPPGSLPATHA